VALPTTDPRLLPVVSSVSEPEGGYTVDGRAYSYYIVGTGLSIFAKPRATWIDTPKWAYDIADLVYMIFDKTNFYTKLSLYFQATRPANMGLEQPLSYYRKTVPCIIYAYARWKAMIDIADIDAASFTAVDSFCLGNNYLFTPAFIEESSLEIIRSLCEASNLIFIYTNGAGKLACGYFYNPPASANWILNEDEIISIKSYSEMLDRELPGVARYGWDARGISPGDPKFGWAKKDVTELPFTADGTVMEGEYESKYVDYGSDWCGSFIDFGKYMRLEVEIGPRAFAWDIDEVVEVFHEALGLGIDPDYHDYFRIHKIQYHLRTMTATVTMVKHKWWNIT